MMISQKHCSCPYFLLFLNSKDTMESILKCVACSVDYYDQLISYQLMLLCSRIVQEVTNNINTYYYFSTGSCIYNLKITSYKALIPAPCIYQFSHSFTYSYHFFDILMISFLKPGAKEDAVVMVTH